MIFDQRPLFGYLQVLEKGLTFDEQVGVLLKFGVHITNIFSDRIGKAGRPGLTSALRKLQQGDTFVVPNLDCLGVDALGVISAVARLHKAGVQLVSLAEGLDGRTPEGSFTFATIAGIARIERQVEADRKKLRHEANREKGIRVGAPGKMTPEIEARAIALLNEHPPLRMAEIARRLEPWIGRTTFFNWKTAREERMLAETEAEKRAMLAEATRQARSLHPVSEDRMNDHI